MSKNKKGICHICGEKKKLTFEHLPPKKANNSNRTRVIMGDELTQHIAGNEKPWDLSKRKYKELQQGMGGYTLCEECNNKTGKYYGAEYIKFASTISSVIKQKIKYSEPGFSIRIEECYVLRIIKQIYAMFASTLPELFVKKRPELQKFILDKNYNDVDWSNLRLSVYAMKEGLDGWTGIMSMLVQDKSGFKTRCVAELALYPFCFILEIDPIGKCENTDITHIADNLEYDTKCILNLPLYYRNRNNLFPFDYRTKEEIERDMIESKLQTIENYKKKLEEKNINSDKAQKYLEQYKNDKIILSELSNKIDEIIKENGG